MDCTRKGTVFVCVNTNKLQVIKTSGNWYNECCVQEKMKDEI